MTDVEVAYNPFDPGFMADPYRQYAELRVHDPVHETPFGVWALFRYDDVLRFLRDPELSVEDENQAESPITAMRDAAFADQERRARMAMLDRDPPDHTRLRKLVSKAFTPRRIEELRPRVQVLVDTALDRAEAAGSLDVIPDLAFPLPFAVISEMLGMPDHLGDPLQLREWSSVIVRALEPPSDFDLLRRIAEANEHMEAFLLDVIRWKRDHLADDLLSALIVAEEEGDTLNDDELLAQVALLFIAGHETTVNLIGNGTLALLRNADQRERLVGDTALDAPAVEELLRFDPPVQMTRRITLTDIEMGGKTIPKGTFVMCSLASANRDEAHFGPDAGALDLGRDDAREHLAFGGGAHYCLGAALARLEASVAVPTLVRRFPELALAGEPVYNGRINLRGLDHLPVSL
ncbi:MAG TPA: cytochrome P450 [Acidimicrobiales bacterium]|nr:cytochrome P450 [Acidimicrobiales bacterium]